VGDENAPADGQDDSHWVAVAPMRS
jgi:hypothetical protein